MNMSTSDHSKTQSSFQYKLKIKECEVVDFFLIQFRKIRIYIIKNTSVFLFSNQESEITEFLDV